MYSFIITSFNLNDFICNFKNSWKKNNTMQYVLYGACLPHILLWIHSLLHISSEWCVAINLQHEWLDEAGLSGMAHLQGLVFCMCVTGPGYLCHFQQYEFHLEKQGAIKYRAISSWYIIYILNVAFNTIIIFHCLGELNCNYCVVYSWR